jgi:hypothetical protein
MQYNSCVRSQCQLRTISLRTVLPMGITVRRNWSTGSDLWSQGQCWVRMLEGTVKQTEIIILTSNVTLRSIPSYPLRHRPSFTPLYNNIQNYRSVHFNLYTCCLLANGRASYVYMTFKAMFHKSTKNNHIYGRPSSGHYYKNFHNNVQTQISYNSHCGMPHVLNCHYSVKVQCVRKVAVYLNYST